MATREVHLNEVRIGVGPADNNPEMKTLSIIHEGSDTVYIVPLVGEAQTELSRGLAMTNDELQQYILSNLPPEVRAVREAELAARNGGS